MGKRKERKAKIAKILTVQAIVKALNNLNNGPYSNKSLEGKIKNILHFIEGVKNSDKNRSYARYLIKKYSLLEIKDFKAQSFQERNDNVKLEIETQEEPLETYEEKTLTPCKEVFGHLDSVSLKIDEIKEDVSENTSNVHIEVDISQNISSEDRIKFNHQLQESEFSKELGKASKGVFSQDSETNQGTDVANVPTVQEQEDTFVFHRPDKRKKKTDSTFVQETVECMESLRDVSKRDEYTMYGELIVHKMRNSKRDRLEISIAQHHINEIMLNLEMGLYANASRVSSIISYQGE